MTYKIIYSSFFGGMQYTIRNTDTHLIYLHESLKKNRKDRYVILKHELTHIGQNQYQSLIFDLKEMFNYRLQTAITRLMLLYPHTGLVFTFPVIVYPYKKDKYIEICLLGIFIWGYLILKFLKAIL